MIFHFVTEKHKIDVHQTKSRRRERFIMSDTIHYQFIYRIFPVYFRLFPSKISNNHAQCLYSIRPAIRDAKTGITRRKPVMPARNPVNLRHKPVSPQIKFPHTRSFPPARSRFNLNQRNPRQRLEVRPKCSLLHALSRQPLHRLPHHWVISTQMLAGRVRGANE